MTELRRDIIRDSWVLIAAGKALTPGEFPINKNGLKSGSREEVCPFCGGHESYTTDEVAAVRLDGSKSNTPGWLIRTIPNKYAAFEMLSGDLNIHQDGIYNWCCGLGYHEVIIETPEHSLELHELPAFQIELLFKMMMERYRALSADPRIKYIQIYKNRGLFAGASQQHSHCQVLAYPVVPDKNRGLPDYFNKHGECLLCQLLEQEKKAKSRIILETDHFVLLCPYASRFSYETWIIPKYHREQFVDIDDCEIKDLQILLKGYLASMLACLDNPSYNIMINSAPVNMPYQGGYHWFLEVTPRMLIANGVEIASGCFMNPVAPEAAADILRSCLLIEI